MKKLEIKTLSDEEIQDLFTEAYDQQVAFENRIGEFECTCKRETVNSKSAKVEVLVAGLAGTPTLDDYKDNKLKNADTVVIKKADKGSLKFKLVPKETVALNTNDYLVVYQSV